MDIESIRLEGMHPVPAQKKNVDAAVKQDAPGNGATAVMESKTPVQNTGESKKQIPRTDDLPEKQEQASDEGYRKTMAEKAVGQANQRAGRMGKDAKFSYNKEIDRITITISDRESGEVIKEIPPEETQKMLERLHTMRGMWMDAEV